LPTDIVAISRETTKNLLFIFARLLAIAKKLADYYVVLLFDSAKIQIINSNDFIVCRKDFIKRNILHKKTSKRKAETFFSYSFYHNI